MDWANERYVRLYTRDTTTWRRLGWDGQCLLTQLLRRADRAGVIDIEDMAPAEAAELHTGAPPDVAERGVSKLLELGVMVHDGTRLVFPSYIEANETPQSDNQRQRESRERRRVTKRDGESQNVTESHAPSRAVTSCHSVPSVLSLPNHPVPCLSESAPASFRSTPGGPPSAMQVGAEVMAAWNATLTWNGGHRNDLEEIGLKPPSEREAVMSTLRTDAWLKARPHLVKPAYVAKEWNGLMQRAQAGSAPPLAATAGTPWEQAHARSRAAERAYRAADADPARKHEAPQLRAAWVEAAKAADALREKCA